MQIALYAWKTNTLDLLTRQWSAVSPFVDPDKRMEFEELLVSKKAQIEQIFSKKIEYTMSNTYKKSLKASLMIRNVEALWNRISKGEQ